MALWIDDTLTRQDEWLLMSHRARSCLIELWSACKLAKADGVLRLERLHLDSESFTRDVLDELAKFDWVHIGATGCGSDVCPRGVEGYVVLHNFLKHQESVSDQKRRIAQASEAKKAAARATNHRRWHLERGITEPTCELCFPTSDR